MAKAKRVMHSGNWMTYLGNMAIEVEGGGVDPHSAQLKGEIRSSRTGGLEIVMWFESMGVMGPTIIHAIWTPEELASIWNG